MEENKESTENSAGQCHGDETGKASGGGGIGAEAWLNDIKGAAREAGSGRGTSKCIGPVARMNLACLRKKEVI